MRQTYLYMSGLGASLAVALLPSVALAQADPSRILRAVTAVSREEVGGLADGTPLVRTLATNDARELAQAYVVRVRAPLAYVLDQIRTGHLLLDEADGDGARGVFTAAPSEEDLERLTFPDAEIRALRDCRPGRCELKLRAGEAARLHASVEWGAPGASADAGRFLRGMLLRTVEAYREGARLVYEDKAEPLDVGDGLERLLGRASELEAADPAFRAHLARVPPAPTEGIEDRYAWTVEDLGLKTLVSLDHIAIRAPGGSSGVAVIGVKRFYASHYFQAALRTLTLLPATGNPEAPDTYVAVVARYRFDGELGGIKRVATERRLERAAEASLAAFRERVERSFAR